VRAAAASSSTLGGSLVQVPFGEADAAELHRHAAEHRAAVGVTDDELGRATPDVDDDARGIWC
jgi:hypothetical protein